MAQVCFAAILPVLAQATTPPVTPNPTANQSTNADLITAWWMLVPGIVGLLTALILLALFQKIVRRVDDELAKSRAKRAAFFAFSGVLIPAVIAIALDPLDLSNVLGGNVRVVDVVTSTIVVVAGCIGGALQIALYIHEDKWSDRLSEADARVSLAEDKLSTTEADYELALKINNAFRRVVALKAQRMRQLCESGAKVDGPSLRKALGPDEQLVAMVEVVFQLYRGLLSETWGEEKSLRAACFVASDGYLTPIYATDGVNRISVPRRGDAEKESFSLTTAVCQSLAAFAAKSHGIEFAEDAEKADTDRGSAFRYFHHDQRATIRSILVMPISDGTTEVPASHVVCIDTDQPGFFNEANLPFAKIVHTNLKERILYELDAKRVLDALDTSNPSGEV